MGIALLMDYSKEEAVIVEKVGYDETWTAGDKCRINNFYLQNYSGMEAYKNTDATVTKVMVRKIRFDKGKEDSMFLLKYGKRDEYDLIGLLVKYPDHNGIYLVSPFGYDKQ